MTNKLHYKVISIQSLSKNLIDNMYLLYSSYYDNAPKELFLKDLSNKKDTIVLFDYTNNLRGFTTIEVMNLKYNNQDIKVLFSGDTIINHKFWGEQTLPLAWCEYAGRIKALSPEEPLYWMLITKGHRTYRFLPVFFKNYYPNRKQENLIYKDLLDFLALYKFKDLYNIEKGILSYKSSQGNLKQKWVDAEFYIQRNKEVEFFVNKNPHYAKGEELVCLAELSEKNLKSFALRSFVNGFKGNNG